MLNKFKIWLNRNYLKIIVTVTILVLGYILLNRLDKFAESLQYVGQSDNENTVVTNESDNTNVPEVNENDLDKVSSSTSEYKDVTKVAQKIINYIYLAQKSDDTSKKQDILNVCSNVFIDNLTTEKRTINTDNIMDYVFSVSNVNDYSVKNIVKYGENGNVKKYAVSIRFDNGSSAIIDSYMVINIDYDNKTFSYDGNVMSLDYVDSTNELENIENKKSNTF